MSNWYDGLAQDVVAHVQKSGWDKLSPEQAAQTAAKSHFEAQNYIGTPADRLIRLPSEATDPAWKAIWGRLGAKGDANEYDFSDVKFSDGKPMEAGFVTKVQTFAAAQGIPLAMAKGLVSEFVKYLDESTTSARTTMQATLKTEKEALAKEWGNNFNLNLEHAKRAAAALGVKPETVAKLESEVGYQGVMKMFQAIGAKIGEDKFVPNNPGGNNNLMNVDQAKEALAAIKADDGKRELILKGDVELNKQIAALTTIIAGDDTADSIQRAGR